MEFTEEQLAHIAKLVAAQKPARKAKSKARSGGRKKLTDDEKAANRAKVDVETIQKFTAAGYKDVKPRENVRTYNKWIESGRMVNKGQKSIKCGSFPLFHLDQTSPIGTRQ